MINYYYDLLQQTPEWYIARAGLLTASDVSKIVTAKKLEYAENDTSRGHLNELLAQRITGYVEPNFRSDDMLRGLDDEKYAKTEYEKHYGQVKDCGFVTNDKWGFTLGCSPDGLVGENRGIQIKSRKAKYQIETIIDGIMPDEFRLQVQTEMLVTERPFWDFISYCGGLPMFTVTILPDPIIQAAIVEAAAEFHARLQMRLDIYQSRIEDKSIRLVPTERKIEQEIHI